MNLKQLINELQEIHEEHGNLDVKPVIEPMKMTVVNEHSIDPKYVKLG